MRISGLPFGGFSRLKSHPIAALRLIQIGLVTIRIGRRLQFLISTINPTREVYE